MATLVIPGKHQWQSPALRISIVKESNGNRLSLSRSLTRTPHARSVSPPNPNLSPLPQPNPKPIPTGRKLYHLILKCSARHNLPPSPIAAMSSFDKKDSQAPPTAAAAATGNGNGVAAAMKPPAVDGIRQTYGDRRLRINPNKEHKADKYDDLKSEFDPAVYSSLEKHMPPSLLEAPRDTKFHFIQEILQKYIPDGERARAQRHKEYRQRIMSAYQPLHKELYNMHADTFFIPSFIKAIRANTEESFRKIMSEPSPGVYTFMMLQPSFCELLLAEVENFEKWVNAAKFKTMKPNTMNKYGAVLDDFGLEPMLNKLMKEFIFPLSRVLFQEVGGSTLDSHHGFVVEYGHDKDVELGFHVDDSEVTLNVCLGKEFSGGELFFRGVRCDKHVNSETQPEEILDHSHVPGQAVLHRGRHRHGARPTTSGHRVNLLLWCRSSVFREMKKYSKDFSGWCGECQREKKEMRRQSVTATKLAFLRSEGGSII